MSRLNFPWSFSLGIDGFLEARLEPQKGVRSYRRGVFGNVVNLPKKEALIQ